MVILSDQGRKSEIQKVQPTGERRDSAQQAALCTPLWYSRRNAALAAPAPELWARVCPLTPFLLVPINTPFGGPSEEITRVLGVVILFLRVIVIFSFLLLLASLAIRVKERESVCKSCI